ncbi:hypothetical protein FUW86_24780 [Escherichia coli]|nr:hypothetical protein [Salmonella enterica subsp. enterica serovar Albany]EFD5348778.1 hypothetical protein [Escherichia coli]
MRQQQDEPGRFSICSRQAAVVLSPLSASLRGFQRLSDAHRAGCPRRWAGGRLWPCKRARNAVEAVCETPRPPALWIPRGKLGPH